MLSHENVNYLSQLLRTIILSVVYLINLLFESATVTVFRSTLYYLHMDKFAAAPLHFAVAPTDLCLDDRRHLPAPALHCDWLTSGCRSKSVSHTSHINTSSTNIKHRNQLNIQLFILPYHLIALAIIHNIMYQIV